MRRFFVGLFAVIGVLSLIVVIAAGGLGYWAFTNFRAEREALPETIILTLDLRGSLDENGSGDPFGFLGFERGLTVQDTVRALDAAREDPGVLGLMALVDGGDQGFAVTQELHQAVRRFAASDKPTLAFADSFGELGPGNVGYYLATAFDQIHLQPVGLVGLTGFAFEMPFVATTLERAGVRFDVERRAEYKTAFEFLTEDAPTEASAEMMQALLDDLQGQLVRDIAARRGLEAGNLSTVISNGPFTAAEAQELRLIDEVGYLDEARDALKQSLGDDSEWFSVENYAADRLEDEPEGTIIASITATGPIVRGESDFGRQIAADTFARALRDATDDPEVEAILMRIDSPGGSAVASETIGREIERAIAEGKPVVVSMGNAAASGGYWLAMKASHIVGEPATLTGSIGVIAGKPVLGELWSKLDVNWASYAKSDNATMWSINQDYTPGQAARVDSLIDATYEAFKEGVAEGRGMAPERVDELARGRVWTGSQAQENGLIDELGGTFEAEAAVRRLAGLEPDAPLTLRPFPAAEDPFDRILALVRGEFGRLGATGFVAALWQAISAELIALPTVWVDLPKVR